MPHGKRPDSETRRREEPAAADEPRRLEDWIRPFFSDSTLWPVLAVAILSLSSFGAALLLLALGARNYFAIAALVVLAGISVDAIWVDLRRRRLGPVAGIILALWSVSALAAAVAVAFGWI
jgi:hypothetical protein